MCQSSYGTRQACQTSLDIMIINMGPYGNQTRMDKRRQVVEFPIFIEGTKASGKQLLSNGSEKPAIVLSSKLEWSTSLLASDTELTRVSLRPRDSEVMAMRTTTTDLRATGAGNIIRASSVIAGSSR